MLVLLKILELLVVCLYKTDHTSIFHCLQYSYYQYCPYKNGMEICTNMVYNTVSSSMAVVFFTLSNKTINNLQTILTRRATAIALAPLEHRDRCLTDTRFVDSSLINDETGIIFNMLHILLYWFSQ